jgi:signal transduction histidine kinase/AmiR/NasT family two-component response regulator
VAEINPPAKTERDCYKRAYEQLIHDDSNFISSFEVNLTRNGCTPIGTCESGYEYIRELTAAETFDECLKKSVSLIPDEKDAERVKWALKRECLLKAFNKGQRKITCEYPVLSRERGSFWVRTTVDLFENSMTADTEGIIYTFDIDEQKQSELIMNRLIDVNYEYIAILRPSAGTMEFRRRKPWIRYGEMRKPFDYEEFCGFLRNLITCDAEREQFDRISALDYIVMNLQGRETHTDTFTTSAAGTSKYYALKYSWLSQPGGDILVVHSDITDTYDQEQEQIRQVKEALLVARKANESKSVFFSSLSHDLRTPLNGILGFTDIALREKDPETVHKYLERIQLSGNLLMDLVNDTLDLSRIESGKDTLQPEVIDSRGLARSVLAAITPVAEQKGVKLAVDTEDFPRGPIFGDRLKLQKIVLNLLSNAVKFTPSGGTVHYSVATIDPPQNGMTRRVVVEDNGIGMSEEFQKHLFEPFTQENREEVGNIVGTGLGLSIVKKIVDLMGGTIAVKSAIGKGSCFTIELPIREAEMPVPEENEVSSEISLKGIRVLVCEDNDLNAEIAGILLGEYGIRTDRAANGREGLELFRNAEEGQYDAVLMDVRMPVMNGYEATKAIRALERPDAGSVPIIAMTADAFEENIRAAGEAGMDDYITKPIDPQKMIASLRKNIARKRAEEFIRAHDC